MSKWYNAVEYFNPKLLKLLFYIYFTCINLVPIGVTQSPKNHLKSIAFYAVCAKCYWQFTELSLLYARNLLHLVTGKLYWRFLTGGGYCVSDILPIWNHQIWRVSILKLKVTRCYFNKTAGCWLLCVWQCHGVVQALKRLIWPKYKQS